MTKDSAVRLMWRAGRVRRQGAEAARVVQRRRLADIVGYARANSPLYERLYRGLPERVEDPALLPVTGKKQLMAEFDDWVTDRTVTWDAARAFVADPDLAGRRFAERYTLVTTSGTTGTPGIFVVDEPALTANVALAGRMRANWLGVGDLARVLRRGGRTAMVVATGGHFLVAAGSRRLFSNPVTARAVRAFSVLDPLPELVRRLNEFRPAVLIGYASVLTLLAGEQRTGRLHIDPVLVEPAGEACAPADRERLAMAFGAKVRDTYGATECPFLTTGCAAGWYHANSDWAVLEPVDAEHRPVAPGEASHTVLISNLANRVQPILRYDLGDSVVQRPGPCPCGDPLPAYRVGGRSGGLLDFRTATGATRQVTPLALEAIIDGTDGVALYQAVQTDPSTLRIRLVPIPGTEPDRVWSALHDRLARWFAANGLAGVVLDRATEPPRQTGGGKVRPVVPFDAAGGESTRDTVH